MLPFLLLLLTPSLGLVAASRPGVVLFLADDLGYGDLGCFGHPSSQTPNLDRLAAEGRRFSDFYSAASVCSPSRAALLTGRYPTRSGVYPGVFYPSSKGGLPLNETTIAELLKQQGYKTAMVGKWHLGYGLNGSYLPIHQGFDKFLGIPYSHDQGPCQNLTCFPPDTKCYGKCDQDVVLMPVFKNDEIIQQPVYFPKLIRLYDNFARHFILKAAKQQKPFFLYYASHHTHYPQFASAGFTGKSKRGPLGDALMEFDASVGVILDALRDAGVENNTLIFFTSDNGPELRRQSRGGNAGLLRCGKGTTYDGGMREPAIAYWPGRITPGVTHELASTLDILPTIASISGAKLPQVKLDGYDMSDILFNNGKSKRKAMFYYPVTPSEKLGVFAVRYGKYKAHYYTQGSILSDTSPDESCHWSAPIMRHKPPLLFDLEADPSENYGLSCYELPTFNSIIELIQNETIKFESGMEFGESQMERGFDPVLEPCIKPDCKPRPQCCQQT
ncbi:arylsulfatase A [Stegostoma tigrinum]|uniref:arylsulfatase A n=1 Tax=Stegostoma tigrinum TaxID=3053191 RepID=UPI002870A1E7|nr:arylsulfatase A [Stegostoma tigrinum]